nr:nitroreductase family protein [Azonexus sp. R2A61]
MRLYHARTKHRFEAFAEGPGQLDWDAQPAAFRHYAGAPRLELPLAADRYERPYGQLADAAKNPVAPSLASLGALFELSFAISAWKSWGPSRWALRCNPSSGNLHPVEAWALCGGLPGVPDGVHHYEAENHALEGRALSGPNGEAPWLAIALSSVMWREAWKYGERAFRYCQLDVGHALGTLAYAAALLGWRIRPLAVDSVTLSGLLGLDRPEFPSGRYAFTEVEEPEILLAVDAPGLGEMPGPAALRARFDAAGWQGSPNRIDPSPGYRWPIIDQAAAASRTSLDDHEKAALARSTAATDEIPHPAPGTNKAAADRIAARPDMPPAAPTGFFPAFPPLTATSVATGTAQLIRQRRSGQRFDPKCTLPFADFVRLLDATLPRDIAPFTGQSTVPHIHLLLFVLRVDGLPPGLYLLPRTPAAADELRATLLARFPAAAPVDRSPAHLGLTLLQELGLQELQRLARSLSCHQDIASTSAFSLGMLGEFDTATVDGPGYRELLREAGRVGQALYLEAEAAGVRGTGIGCFFDDPVHTAFGLAGTRWQSVYHFTVGTPVIDARLETSPPYPQRPQEKP